MDKPQIGVVGMAVMGKNLALNIEDKGYTVAVYDWDSNYTKKAMADHPDKRFVPSYSIEDFVNSLERPRKILMMVKAGALQQIQHRQPRGFRQRLSQQIGLVISPGRQALCRHGHRYQRMHFFQPVLPQQ